jgi:Tfp pilus assembly protein PilX
MRSVQSGFVLFLALIVLTAMTLAALALVKTVDTTTQLARNVSFKRDATNRADLATEAVMHSFRTGQFFAQGNNTIANATNRNFSAVLLPSDVDGIPSVLKQSNFSSTWTAPAVTLGGANQEGMNVVYLIERMCAKPGPSDAQTCVLGGATSAGGTQVSNRPSSVVPAMFRLSVRVGGPRNTVSYTQSVFTLQIS